MRTLTESERQLIKDSGLFDGEWYAEKYPDVGLVGIDPLEHFVRIGIHAGHDPGPNFSSDYYLHNNHDVRISQMQPLLHFIQFGRKEGRLHCRSLDSIRWGIMTPMHTLYVGHLFAERLKAHGWHAEIITQEPEFFLNDFYVVLCPQTFHRLPSEEKRVVFQLEQSVSSRWFTDNYFKVLNNSLAVLDYSLINIEFLAERGLAFPHVYYMPIGLSNSYGKKIDIENKKYDVLFYGDYLSSPRRCKMLEALKTRFNVHIASEVFGDTMIRTIKESRLVINLHYYQNALLEMPRIQECLSLGVKVVSESTRDQDEYPELSKNVTFFKENSIDDMLLAVEQALGNPTSPANLGGLKGQSRFDFMLDRFLVGRGFLSSEWVKKIQPPVPSEVTTFAISLPETIKRRRAFENARPPGCFIYDGIRYQPGWVGCGLSYASIARYARNNGFNKITIMEDDVLLPANYKETLDIIEEFLDLRNGKWDVFSGLMAVLDPQTKILGVEEYKGRSFVTINKMISMVYNIYSERILDIMVNWNPRNINVDLNTIDKFLEGQNNLRVVVMLPFFVGHKEELDSTLWGFQNTQYTQMIDATQTALREKAATYALDSRAV